MALCGWYVLVSDWPRWMLHWVFLLFSVMSLVTQRRARGIQHITAFYIYESS